MKKNGNNGLRNFSIDHVSSSVTVRIHDTDTEEVYFAILSPERRKVRDVFLWDGGGTLGTKLPPNSRGFNRVSEWIKEFYQWG